MILERALVASLRISEVVTASTGMFVKRFKVGISSSFWWEGEGEGAMLAKTFLCCMNGWMGIGLEIDNASFLNYKKGAFLGLEENNKSRLKKRKKKEMHSARFLYDPLNFQKNMVININ